MNDTDYMREAIAQAQAASERGEVPVGAILVDPDTGNIVARAGNAPISLSDPTAHAEINVIRQACSDAKNYRLSGLTLYVTLEPCTMCAGAISQARIARVVYGASDSKGGAVASGVQFFDNAACHHRPEVVGGIEAELCGALLKSFFKARRAK